MSRVESRHPDLWTDFKMVAYAPPKVEPQSRRLITTTIVHILVRKLATDPEPVGTQVGVDSETIAAGERGRPSARPTQVHHRQPITSWRDCLRWCLGHGTGRQRSYDKSDLDGQLHDAVRVEPSTEAA